MGERVGKESDPIVQHYGWTGSRMQVDSSDQFKWVKVKNTII